MPGLILPVFGSWNILYLLKKLVIILKSNRFKYLFRRNGVTGTCRVSAHDTGSVRNRTVVICHCCNSKWRFYQNDIISWKYKINTLWIQSIRHSGTNVDKTDPFRKFNWMIGTILATGINSHRHTRTHTDIWFYRLGWTKTVTPHRAGNKEVLNWIFQHNEILWLMLQD